MIERIPGIYEITLYDRINTVNEIRVFLIPGKKGERSLLIDAGFQNDESRRTLLGSLTEAGVSCENLDVFLTHKHHDHTGLARTLMEMGARIFMNPEENRHPYDCLCYTQSEKALEEQTRVLRTVGVTPEKTPRLWEEFMRLNEHLKKPEKSMFFRGGACPCSPIKAGQMFCYGDYRFEAVPLRGHTFGQMGLWDSGRCVLFCADQLIDGIVPIVATAYMNEHLLQMYFQSLDTFEKKYRGCTILPSHNDSFTDTGAVVCKIQEAYRKKLDLIRHIVAFGTRPITIKEAAFKAYGISLLPQADRDSQIIKIKMILTKTFSCLEYLHDMGECSRISRDGILYWGRDFEGGGPC